MESLCAQIKRFVPPWMAEAGDPYLCAAAVAQAQSREDTTSMFLEVEPGTASGAGLTLLAQTNFGLERRTGETDAQLVRRIQTPGRAVTRAHILDVATELLDDFGYGPPIIVPWYEGGHFLDEADEFDTGADTAGGLYLGFNRLPLVNGFEVYVDPALSDAEKRALGQLLAERVALGCRFQILPDDLLPIGSATSEVVTEADVFVVTEADEAILVDAPTVDVSGVFPESAWGIWNAYTQQSNGDSYTAGVEYLRMADQSGNGRDAEPFTAGNTPAATTATFPGRLYDIAAPDKTSNIQSMYHFMPADRLDSFTFVYLSPYNRARSNTGSEWNVIKSFFGSLFKLQLSFSGANLVYQPSFNTVPFGSTFTIPNGASNQSPDAWAAAAVRCSVSGGTASWRVIMVYDFGAGVALAGDSAFSETASLTGAADTARSDWRGFGADSTGETGCAAFWDGALSDEDLRQALISAVSWRSEDAARDVASLV